MMTEIFNDSSKPFYRFGDIMLLQKIQEEKWVTFIQESFAATGKIIAKKWAETIPKLMNNHSWYVQQMAHYTWQKTDKEVQKEHISSALEELIHANTPFYQQEVENISTTQLNLLKAISKGEYQLTSAKVMQDYKLGTPRNVSKNKPILINEDIIQETESGYEFLAPSFEIWFKKTYFNMDYLNVL